MVATRRVRDNGLPQKQPQDLLRIADRLTPRTFCRYPPDHRLGPARRVHEQPYLFGAEAPAMHQIARHGVRADGPVAGPSPQPGDRVARGVEHTQPPPNNHLVLPTSRPIGASIPAIVGAAVLAVQGARDRGTRAASPLGIDQQLLAIQGGAAPARPHVRPRLALVQSLPHQAGSGHQAAIARIPR